jgi:hypothetical protein
VSCTVAVTVWRTVQNSNAKKPQEFAKIEKKSDLTKKYSIVAMSSYRYIPRIYFAYLVHFFWWISGQSSQNSGWKRRRQEVVDCRALRGENINTTQFPEFSALFYIFNR